MWKDFKLPFPIRFCLSFYAEIKLFAKNILKGSDHQEKKASFKFHGTNDCKHDSGDNAKCKKWWKLGRRFVKVPVQKKVKREHPTFFNGYTVLISLPQFSLQKCTHWKISPVKSGVSIRLWEQNKVSKVAANFGHLWAL